MKKIFLLLFSLLLTFANIWSVSAVYDLALKKTILNHGPYKVWDSIVFQVEVINQWDELAENIRVTDYISSGLRLSDSSWTQTGSIETWFFAEYEFNSIPVWRSQIQNISYTITDDSDSLITSHSEISRDNGDDCDSLPDRNILNDGILLDDYIGTGCETDEEIGEDDHDSEVITIRGRKKSRFNLSIKTWPSLRTWGIRRNYVVVNRSHYIPVEVADTYINIPWEEPHIVIDVKDYDFTFNEELSWLTWGTLWANDELSVSYDVKNNKKLIAFWENSDDKFIDIAEDIDGNVGFFNTLIEIAKSLKNLFYAIAGIFFLIITIRLIFASNTDEELWKFKKWVIWITVGLIVMQLALSFVTIGFDQGVSAEIGENIIFVIVQPMLLLLQTLASIFFMAVAIFSFYRLITANGNEESAKSGKMSILYAIIGFMIVRFAGTIVNAFYGQVNCSDGSSGGQIVATNEKICRNEAEFSEWINLIMSIITWLNSFVALVVMLMIIYAWAQILLSGGDEEKIKKWKQALIYIAIGIVILAINYLILTFFFAIPADTASLNIS